MKHIIISANQKVWAFCNDVHMDYVMIDLETKGKRERQAGKSTWISDHTIQDIVKAKMTLTLSTLIVRINSIHESSKQEIDDVIEAGADLIMLPYFNTLEEVNTCYELVNQRVGIVLLFETLNSLTIADEIFKTYKVEFAHVGLNDLSMELRYPFLFEILKTNLIDYFFEIAHRHGVPSGFGGIGYSESSKISPKLIYSEHVRLQSSRVIISRDFVKNIDINSKNSSKELEKRFKQLLGIQEEVDKLNSSELQALTDNLRDRLSEVTNA